MGNQQTAGAVVTGRTPGNGIHPSTRNQGKHKPECANPDTHADLEMNAQAAPDVRVIPSSHTAPGAHAEGDSHIVESSQAEDNSQAGDGSRASSTGYLDDKDRVIARLRRIEGQTRAITRMVEQDTYCIDVITQISACDKALKAVALKLMDSHLNHCVRRAASEGGAVADEKLAEASAAIARLVRS